ncbi:MAG TPA: carboxymuconolactone decarboxylase family protein [Acidimicrobiia bacterium]
MDEKPHIHVLDYDETTGVARGEYDAALRRVGRIWNIVSIQCQLPEVMRDSMRIYRSIMYGPSPLTRAQREMMAVVTSQVNECHY